jgi:ABC-2 type transport system permease protein
VRQLVGSELLKVRTTRGWYAYLAVVVLLVGIAVAGDIGSTEDANRSTLSFQLGLVESAAFASLLAIILGITMVTTEFRHGTITPTLLAAPHRERVIAGKAAGVALVAVLFALLALVVVAGVGLTWLSIVGDDVHLGDAEIGKRAGQVILLTVLWGLIGLAVGAVVHSQVAALVGTLVWIFLGETLLLGLFGVLDLDGARAYLPFQALDGADGTSGEDLLSYGPAVAVSLGWIALLGAAGVARTRRRDIT